MTTITNNDALREAVQFNLEAGRLPFESDWHRFAVVREGRCCVLPMNQLTRAELTWIADLQRSAADRELREAAALEQLAKRRRREEHGLRVVKDAP